MIHLIHLIHRIDTTAVLIGLLTLAGCGVHSVAGGTTGQLQIGDEPMSEIQITVYRIDGGDPEPIGMAVSNSEGEFQLLTNGAQGALWLEPGEYRFTLESIGPPIQFSREYTQPETTPLSIEWSADESVLELIVPQSGTQVSYRMN
jgi:hypothetical protein